MNTPAHAILNALVLAKRGASPPRDGIVFLGAVLPDLPMFAVYGVEKARGVAEQVIWSTSYYQPAWQSFFDVFNSVPVIALTLFVGWRRPTVRYLALSMLLHAAADFPLHHDDGHRHFWPLDYRFESPVSYWDPAHYGQWFAPVELLFTLAGSVWLFRHTKTGWRWAYALIGLLAALGGALLLTWLLTRTPS